MITALLLTGVAVAATLFYLFYKTKSSGGIVKLPNIPHVDLEGEKTRARYVAETGALMEKGYAQYSKKGLPFSIPNLSDMSRPVVILPLRYLLEVAHAPQSKLSLPEYFAKLGLLKYTYGPPIADVVQHVARTDLNRALNDLVAPLQEACAAAYAKDMPPCKDWTPVMPFMVLMNIFIRMGAHMLVGPDLQDKWTAMSFEYLPVFVKASRKVGAVYSDWTRWLAPLVDADVKAVKRTRRKAADIIAPIIQARLYELTHSTSRDKRQHQDAVQWLLEEHKSRGRTPSADELAQNLLVMTVSSTHQTTMTSLWILFDLIDHPDSLGEIREEISRVEKKLDNGVLTHRALGELKILDSFMTESMRFHAFTQTTVNRMVMAPFTFKDGLSLPEGTQLSFPTQQYSRDSSVHSDPDVFDPKRHLRKRQDKETSDPDGGNRYHFASTADTLIWGSGPHACPGRFFVGDALKLIFVRMLMGYDFKYPEDKKPAAGTPHKIMTNPDVTMPVLFKEKKASE